MASRAQRYSYSSYGNAAVRASVARPERQQRPGIQVVPGRGRKTQQVEALSPFAVNLFKVVVAIAIILAALLAARVAVLVSTVQSMQAIEAVQSDIEIATAQGNELEIQHSVLASPERIATEAAALGMYEPENVTHITVTLPAHEVYNADGTLTFFGTIETVENAAAATF